MTVLGASPYLQVVRDMWWNGGPSPHFIFVSHVQSKMSAGMACVFEMLNSLLDF